MEKNDLDALLAGASAGETDRIHRMLHQWGVGPEDSFPVQLALLTKAQWRAAAGIPRSVGESLKLINASVAEYRQQIATLLKQFNDSGDARLGAFEKTAEGYVEAMKLIAAQSHGHMVETEKAARQVRAELDRSTTEFGKEMRFIRNEITVERERLESAQRALERRASWQDWLKRSCIIAGVFLFGVGVGRLVQHWK